MVLVVELEQVAISTSVVALVSVIESVVGSFTDDDCFPFFTEYAFCNSFVRKSKGIEFHGTSNFDNE